MGDTFLWDAVNSSECSQHADHALCILRNPWFYLAGIPTVLLTGISKGGFGGIAMISVPLLALVMSPVTAAGVMLPILIVMDALSVWTYRCDVDWTHLKVLLPGAVLGIAGGYISIGWMNDDVIRLLLAALVVCFLVYTWFMRGAGEISPVYEAEFVKGGLWGCLSGYTSFLAHAGAPPMHVYLIPKQLEPRVFAATGVVFFAFVNLLKLPPYLMTGQISSANLLMSIILLPFAPLGVALGVFMNKRIPKKTFFNILYVALLLVAAKLVFDGWSGLS
ncbi:MAG: sulfite exporter TauE/SafE family protein [Myxococcales bacterium]|nr:sulfite exporter TauE/SafE family protein [Myxococcales bacterium]